MDELLQEELFLADIFKLENQKCDSISFVIANIDYNYDISVILLENKTISASHKTDKSGLLPLAKYMSKI